MEKPEANGVAISQNAMSNQIKNPYGSPDQFMELSISRRQFSIQHYIIQVKICAEYWDMIPKAKAGFSGTWAEVDRPKRSCTWKKTAKALGTMSRYFAQSLTHWPLGDFKKLKESNFPANFSDWWVKYFL